MKTLKEMSDQELATEVYQSLVRFFGDDCTYEGFGAYAQSYDVADAVYRRLSEHPAQRLADTTGQCISKNAFGSWLIWDFGFEPEFIKSGHHYHVINLPDDGRPCAESVYRPKNKSK